MIFFIHLFTSVGNFDNSDLIREGLGTAADGKVLYGWHFALIDYKTGNVFNIKPIPIFAFDNDLKFTIFTNEEKALLSDRSARGSIVLDQTKAKEADRDLLNVNVDLFGDNRDVIPQTNSVLQIDTSTLIDDIELIDDTKRVQ